MYYSNCISRVFTIANSQFLYNQATIIQRAFRDKYQSKIIIFVTSPYDRPLGLNNKKDWRLFNNICNRLNKEDWFNRKLASILKYLKLIGKELRDYRLDNFLHIVIE